MEDKTSAPSPDPAALDELPVRVAFGLDGVPLADIVRAARSIEQTLRGVRSAHLPDLTWGVEPLP